MLISPWLTGYRHVDLWNGQTQIAPGKATQDRTRPIPQFVDAFRQLRSMPAKPSIRGDVLVGGAANIT